VAGERRRSVGARKRGQRGAGIDDEAHASGEIVPGG
jgi:hypothetical protein